MNFIIKKKIIMKGVINMSKQNKENQAIQKGQRRARLQKGQNNRDNEKNPPAYTDFNGKPIV